MRMRSALAIAALVVCAVTQAGPEQTPTPSPPVNRTVLPIPAAPFIGTIGLRPKESTPSFPSNVTAPAGAPNVLLVLLDDVGFGATSSFGGPINTPTIQKLSETAGHRCSQANSYLAGHIRQRTETVR